MARQSELCEIGFIGLGVMGKNLALNLADNGYSVAAFDLDPKRISEIVEQDKAETEGKGGRIHPCSSISELLKSLTSPHLIVLSVPAGEPVDAVCEQLVAHGISCNDIIVDTGNSQWRDTVRREKDYKGKLTFFSTAVSGGEEGARFGPSLMPSGDPKAWERIEPLWKAIAAKVNPETGKPIERFEPGNPVTEGEPCATYIGPNGAGHFVKTVHNGIEYADMQLICEAYHLMRSGLGMTPLEISYTFKQWNTGVLDSYLIEISAEVLAQVDEDTQRPLIDIIRDTAGQKGTGLWTAISSLEIGSPATTITSAVYARALSTLKDERVTASSQLQGPAIDPALVENREEVIQQLHDALYCSKICAYAQGFQLMKAASEEQGWELDFAEIAKIWRAGCIIRAVFLQSITLAYSQNNALQNLLLDPFFAEQINKFQGNWRKAISTATLLGIPFGAISSALAYFDSYRTETLPANLLQGQRDFFGAHTFERIDQPKGQKYHVCWSAPGRPLVTIE